MGIECTPEEREILNSWPVVTAHDIERMNDLFPHYIFFRKKKTDALDGPSVEFHASCCGHRESIPLIRRTELPWENELLEACSHNQDFTCPWCGRRVCMKDLAKAGQRKSLGAYRYAVLLHDQDEALYGDAVVLRKDYGSDDSLASSPEFWLSSSYRFTIGDVMQIDYQCYGDGVITHETGTLKRQKKVSEPFKFGYISYYSHEPYAIIGREVLEDHPKFRYCQFFGNWQYRPGGGRGYQTMFHEFISYMTAYCIYPRQIEMFVKAGYTSPVAELLYSRKKNADAINWAEPDARKALGLSKQELHQFFAMQPPLTCIAVKKHVAKHWGREWPLSFCMDFANLWGVELSPMYVLSFLWRYRIDPEKFLHYLNGLADFDRLRYATPQYFFDLYRDYIEAAYILGRCMEHSAVLFPPMLLTAHDETVAELAKYSCGKADELGPVGMHARALKYEFELDGLKIVFPLTEAAIRREGQALAHCVGGYAQRHMKGVLSILFLRKSDSPLEPYVTIEMHGNKLQQIHGYLNDRNAVSPRVHHKKFIDTWLEWLKKGSPRDDEGRPLLPKKKTGRSRAA